eukprot:1296997-Amphidinium_carterae.1
MRKNTIRCDFGATYLQIRCRLTMKLLNMTYVILPVGAVCSNAQEVLTSDMISIDVRAFQYLANQPCYQRTQRASNKRRSTSTFEEHKSRKT